MKKQAFVNGVSVLDSNPDAYNFVKKKIKKGLEGTKVDLTPLDLDTLYNNYKKFGRNRYMDTLLLRQLDNLLIKRGMGKPQRYAVVFTSNDEGNTIKDHGNGAAGLVGWRGTRASNLPITVEGLADKIYDETFGSFNGNNWSHGGKGSGYQTAKEALKAFLEATTPEEAIKAFNYGYVRPPKEDTLYRIKTIKNLYKKGGVLKAQDGTKLTGWLKVGNFLNSDYGNLILNGVQQGLSYFSNKPKSTKADKEAFIKNYIAQNSVNPNLFYLLAYQELITSPDIHASDIVARNTAYKLALLYNSKLKNDANAAWALYLTMQNSGQQSSNNFLGLASNILGGIGLFIGPKQTDGLTEIATTPEKAILTTASPSLDERVTNPSIASLKSINSGESFSDWRNRLVKLQLDLEWNLMDKAPKGWTPSEYGLYTGLLKFR